MCWAMAKGIQNQEGVPENLRKQLAVAVRSVQWSYAIFWSPSTKQEGVLEWSEGYYNGDIKTRKTVQAMELKPDKMGLRRSEQLRELYESLLDGESDLSKRPSAALSPEDLTDAEWYYLVCMSFVFNHGQSLPGRALANGQPIWLCNAHCADSKVFSRSLLAKSASIQTVVCFPHLGGVIELGVTELVLEDPNLIQHIMTSLLEFSKPVCSQKSSSTAHNTDDDTDHMCVKVDHDIVDTAALENFYSTTEDIRFNEEGLNELDENFHDDFTMGSPDECSNGCEHNQQTEDSFMLEGLNGGASQVQSWHFMDDDFSNCVQGSLNSSDCISQAFVNQEKAISPPKHGNANNLHLKELQERNHTKFSSLDLGNGDNLHYRRTLSTILSSHQLIENLCFQNGDHKSSFVNWKKGGIVVGQRSREQQKMLKKILLKVPLMHGGYLLRLHNDIKDWLSKPENDKVCEQQALPDKITENEKFLVLKSMVPSVSKIDKASILGDAIKYLKELEARVEELESCIDLTDEARVRRKYPDMVEQMSDNYENRRIAYVKKSWINKRKASDIDDSDTECNNVVPNDGPLLDMKINIKEQEVLIEMRCPWRESLLLDVIDAINSLNLDAHTVQSSTVDGILNLTIKTKFRGAAVASARMIKQELSRIAGKC